MSEGLPAFFASMGRYFADSARLDDLLARHPGWEAAPARVALYGRFVDRHIRGVLDKLYPLCRTAVGEEKWEELARAFYRTRPGTHYELNRAGEGFPAFLADQTGALGLPDFVPALARFEWVDFAVYAAPERIPSRVEALTANPTLATLEHPFRLCDYVRATPPRPPAPSAGPELALLWRHPSRETTHFLAADDRALLVLKMAVEGLSVGEVAAVTGLTPAQLERWIAGFADDGLVLAPSGG